jgi:GAF domain
MDTNQFGENSEEISIVKRSSAEEIIYPYIDRLIRQAETVLDLDPSYNEAFLFQILAKNIVDFFEAEVASIWLLENNWQHLASFFRRENLFGDYKKDEWFEFSIAQEVARVRQPLRIADIWKEDRWQNKESLRKFGVNSALFVPISSPRFSIQESDPGGVLQVFYREKDKAFSSLEIKAANCFRDV